MKIQTSVSDPKEICIFNGDVTSDFVHLCRMSGILACDIETTGLDWKTNYISTCQLLVPNEAAALIKLNDAVPENLSLLIADPNIAKVFHHAMFDLRFMHFHWDTLPASILCTKIALKLLDPNQKRESSLKSALKHYFSISLDKSLQKSDWAAAALSKEQVEYAITDVVHLVNLLNLLRSELRRHDLEELYLDCCSHLPTRVRLDVLNYPDIYTY